MAVRLTRRELVAGAGAVALARDASAESVSVRTFIGKAAGEMTPLVGEALARLTIRAPSQMPYGSNASARRNRRENSTGVTWTASLFKHGTP